MKRIIILLVFLLLVGQAKAVTIIGPASATLNPGKSITLEYTLILLPNETATVNMPNIPLEHVFASFDKTYFSNPETTATKTDTLHVYLSADDSATVGSASIITMFTSNNQPANLTYSINISKNYYNIFDSTLGIGDVLNIGTNINLKIINIGQDVQYELDGCTGYAQTIIAHIGEPKIHECPNVNLRITAKDVYSFGGLYAASLMIESTEPLITSTTQKSGGCNLAINTITTATRDSNFAFETVDGTTGNAIDGVSIVISDLGSPTSTTYPKHTISDGTGFASILIDGDTTGPLLLRLTKDTCNPLNQRLEFDTPYNVYVENQKAKTLQINMSVKVGTGVRTGKVIDGLGKSVPYAIVQAEKPDSTVAKITTDSNGTFTMTFDTGGAWVLQTSKTNYQPSDPFTVQVVKSFTYNIVPYVNDVQTSEIKTGDKVVFKMLDSDGSILKINTPAKFDDIPINFIQGVSDTVVMKKAGKSLLLEIPETTDYNQVVKPYEVKGFEISSTAWIIIGVIALAVIIFFAISMTKGGSGPKSESRYTLNYDKFE